MEKDSAGKLIKDFGISEETNAAVEEALRKATREALKKHKLAGNPVAVWRDGKVVILQPEEITFET